MRKSVLEAQYKSYLSFQERLKECGFPYDNPLQTKEAFFAKEKARINRLLEAEAKETRHFRN